MNKWFVCVVLAGMVHGARAQDAEDPAAARERIARERSQVEAAFKAEEKACYQKFAVNDCLKAARAHRREVMADLKRQEISLNDAERRRKGAERQRAIEERAEAERRGAKAGQPAKGPNPMVPRGPAGPTVGQKQAERADAQARNAANASERQRQAQVKAREKETEVARRTQEAAKNAADQKKRQAEAAQHKASVQKRLAERNKPPAAPLPPPSP